MSLLLTELGLICFLVIVYLSHKRAVKNKTVKGLNWTKGRLDYSIVDYSYDRIEFNVDKWISNHVSFDGVIYNHPDITKRPNVGFQHIDLGTHFEINMELNGYKDVYYYIPKFSTELLWVPRRDFVTPTVNHHYMHLAQVALVNKIVYERDKKGSELTRDEIIEIVHWLRKEHPRTKPYDFECGIGLVMIKIVATDNHENIIEQMVPYA